jgi:endonuclease YncB( thermonuclease family)
MRRLTATVSLLTILLAACTSGPDIDAIDDSSSVPSSEPSTTTTEVTLPPAEEVERGTVDGVVNGDTLQAVVGGQRIEIGLIGVAAPDAEDCYGAESRNALSAMVAGQTVLLGAGETDVDASGRALRYVIIESNPPVLVNAELVSQGAVIPLHSGHAQESDFLARGDRAYASGKGLWGTFVCGQTNDGASPDRPQLRISEVNLAPQGAGELDLTEESIQIVNQSYTAVDLSGWLVRNETGERYLALPQGTAIAAGGSLRIVTGCGNDSGEALYWCSETPVWSTSSDTVLLRDQLGNVVDRKPYEVEE